MRLIVSAALSGALAAAFVPAAATAPAAAAPLFPWCAHYMMRGGGISCAFGTLDQCLRTISGVGGSCQRNPYLEDSPPPSRRPRHTKRRHSRG